MKTTECLNIKILKKVDPLEANKESELSCLPKNMYSKNVFSHFMRGGAMVLGKRPVPGRPIIWLTVGQGPTALAVGPNGGRLDIFLSSVSSLFFLPLFGRRSDIDCNTVSKGR